MRIRLVAVALAACTLAAGCGDDDSDDGGSSGNGGGGGLYGGGGAAGEDDDRQASGENETGGDDSGGGEDEAGGLGSTRLRLAADPGGELAFDKDSLTAEPGPVVISFSNRSGIPHAVEVEGNGVEEETETITDGSARLALDLEAGEYTFYCPVGNHQQAGMSGTLTVR